VTCRTSTRRLLGNRYQGCGTVSLRPHHRCENCSSKRLDTELLSDSGPIPSKYGACFRAEKIRTQQCLKIAELKILILILFQCRPPPWAHCPTVARDRYGETDLAGTSDSQLIPSSNAVLEAASPMVLLGMLYHATGR